MKTNIVFFVEGWASTCHTGHGDIFPMRVVVNSAIRIRVESSGGSMNWKRFTALPFARLAVLMLRYQPAQAQSNVQAGSIQGVVTDPQGGVVPDAKVTITNKDTGATLDATSTSAGTFTSGSLVPGNYTVRVEAPSFKTVTGTYVVQINQVSSATIKLELGASS